MTPVGRAVIDDAERKRRIRRNVALLVFVALAFYVAFIVLHLSGR